MRVMVVSPYLPHGRIGHGGGTAVRDLVRSLARRHDTTLFALCRPGEDRLVADVETLGARVVAAPYLDRGASGPDRLRVGLARGRACARALRSGYPLYAEKYWSRAIADRLLAAVVETRPEAVQFEYMQLALLCRDLRRWRGTRPGDATRVPKLIINSHEMGSLPLRRRAGASPRGPRRAALEARARAWDRLALAATGWADATLCVTEQDRALLAAAGGRNCVTVPLGMDTDLLRPCWEPTDPARLLFVGSFGHRPNREAAKFLVDKIWPTVAQYSDSVSLILAGRGSDAFLGAANYRQERVRGLGYVEDLTSLYRECRLFVAPLTEGGGIKIKILEAMAQGIPVVTTPIGAEGIVDSAEDAVVIAEPGAAFAEAMIRALNEPDACRLRARRARRIIEERFSWSAITERLTSLYEGR